MRLKNISQGVHVKVCGTDDIIDHRLLNSFGHADKQSYMIAYGIYRDLSRILGTIERILIGIIYETR